MSRGIRKLLPNICLVGVRRAGVRGCKTDYPNLFVQFWYAYEPCVNHPLRFQVISSKKVAHFAKAITRHRALYPGTRHRSFELHLNHSPTCGDSSKSWVLDEFLWRCGGTCWDNDFRLYVDNELQFVIVVTYSLLKIQSYCLLNQKKSQACLKRFGIKVFISTTRSIKALFNNNSVV